MEKMRLAILSDLHIADLGEFPYGVDTRSNFLKALDLAVNDRPDMLIITGDLCFREGVREVYCWIKNELDKTGLPYRVISGNHDKPALLQKVFHPGEPLMNSEFFYSETIRGKHFIFCDSTNAILSETQWHWLVDTIEESGDNVFIFIHHPPFRSAVPYMDEHHAFEQMEKMEDIIANFDKNFFLFCGHYHCEKTIIRDQCIAFITPSTFFNLDDRYEDFTILNKIPSFRRLVISTDQIETGVFS
ncbi:MAG: hypothetical protein EA362_05265 [Saprospirales bacterium]|nr:MAG: hypothetical protein EA362_05265 [Saprospirales bacterium]